MPNIFQDSTKSIPKNPPDSMIVRVTMEQSEIAGRKDHMPSAPSSAAMGISHVPNKS